MGRILLLVGLGVLSPVVYLLGAEPFEVPGQNPIMERVGGSLAVAVFCAMCQFWYARSGVKPVLPAWVRVFAMVTPIGATCLVVEAVEGGQSWRYAWGPLLVAGCVGSVVGVVLGGRSGRAGASAREQAHDNDPGTSDR